MEKTIQCESGLWEKIVKANNEIETIKLKGKDYAEVKERVIAFRKVYPKGTIATEITYTENYVIANAKIYTGLPAEEMQDYNILLATGNARELANKPFALENAETSAIGRALGMCGFGIKTSIASFEDMQNIDSPSGVFNENVSLVEQRRKEASDRFNKLTPPQQAEILNLFHKKTSDEIELNTLEDILRNTK